MQTISFLQTSPDQLQREINAVVRIILEDFQRNINYKKRKRELLIHLIEPSLLQNNQCEIITSIFHVILAIIKTKQNF